MTDCRAYEFYGTPWDVLDCSDHRLHHSSDGYVYQPQNHGYDNKETRQDLDDFTRRHEYNDRNAEDNIIQKANFPSSLTEGKSMLLDTFWSKSNQYMFPMSTMATSINEASTSASDDAEMSSNCLYPETVAFGGDSLFLNDPIFQNANIVDEENLRSSPFDIFAECGNLSFRENEYDGTGTKDLWMSKCLESPDLSQFEDFGQMKDLSWFLSDGHLCSSTLPSLVYLQASKPLLPDSCESSLGNENHTSSLTNGCFAQSLDADGADLEFQATSERIFTEHGCQPRTSSYSSQSRDLFVNPGQGAQNDKKKFFISDTSASEIFSYQPDGPQNCLVGLDLFDRVYPQDPRIQMDHDYRGQIPRTGSELFIESENKLSGKVSFQAVSRGSLFDVRMHQQHSNLPVEKPDQQFASQTVSTSQNSLKKKLRRQEDQAEDDPQLLVSTTKTSINRDADLFSRPESSFRASPCSENVLLGPINFQELQDSLDKMDIRTKLCLRDGLYRLARNAEQRRSVGDRRTCSVDSDRFPEFMDVETGTNPIDRTISYLLVHKDSRTSTFRSNDAMSLDSHVML